MIWALHGFSGMPGVWDEIGLTGPALLGHGGDAVAREGDTFEGEVARLVGTIPSAQVHLVGYSLGARLSLAIALSHPDRVRSLSLIGVNPGLAHEHERAERRHRDAQWAALLRSGGIGQFVDRWQALPLWKSQAALSGEVRQRQRELRLSHDSEQLALSLLALGTGSMPPMGSRLGELAMPVQLIAGANDPKYLQIGLRLCEQLPQASLHAILGSGHNPLLEQPEALQKVLEAAS